MADIFISYSSKDETVANNLCSQFEKEGLSCWIAPRNIEVGQEYGGEIIKGIEESKVFFLCLSGASNESQHVLREVERAVNRKMSIVVYQQEEVTLSKSMEYFLASTQWFIPGKDNGMNELVRAVKSIKEDRVLQKEKVKASSGKRKNKWIGGLGAATVLLFVIGILIFFGRNDKEIVVGDTFTFGSIDLTGSSEEPLTWTVLQVDEKEKTALCIADNIVAFFPYDGAESGMRAQDRDTYFNNEKIDEYTDEQLTRFWGSSDWETANIRSWLNSDKAIVEYDGALPTEDGMSLYENGYESRAGFLYGFTEEEKEQLVETKVVTTLKNGQSVETTDKVFLLSYEEVEKYLVEQNFVLAAVPCENAVLLEGTGIYNEYYTEGERSTYWALRTEGENACSILCAGTGLGKTETFHSEYACSSLMGIRPAVVLPVEYVGDLID